MSYNVELKASIVVQDSELEAPGVKVRNEKDDTLTADEFSEVTLIIPTTTVDSTYSTAKKLKLTSAGLYAKVLMIRASDSISIVLVPQGDPITTWLQPVRSLYVGTFDTDDAPAEVKFVNLNEDPVTVKVVVGSVN